MQKFIGTIRTRFLKAKGKKTGNQNVQLVFVTLPQTSRKYIARVLLPTVLQNYQVAAICVNTDFSMEKITRESLHTREERHLLQNKFASGR